MVAKAYARIGKAFFVQAKWAEAVVWYDKAAINDRHPDYLTMKKKVRSPGPLGGLAENSYFFAGLRLFRL